DPLSASGRGSGGGVGNPPVNHPPAVRLFGASGKLLPFPPACVYHERRESPRHPPRWALMRPLLLLLLACPTAHPAAGKRGADAAADESTLKAAGLRTDDAALLDFFRSRTLSPAQQDVYSALVEDLSSKYYPKRVKATEALAKSGYRIKALLARV